MANVCIDNVVFYPKDKTAATGLDLLKQALFRCYPENRTTGECALSRIFDNLGIPTGQEKPGLPGFVTNVESWDDAVFLECSVSWLPLEDAYRNLAEHFGLNFAILSEEPECGLYLNTDKNRTYFKTSYKVVLYEKPDDGVLDRLFEETVEKTGDTDYYFDTIEELLAWFAEKGNLVADTWSALDKLLQDPDEEYLAIHEFTDSYK